MKWTIQSCIRQFSCVHCVDSDTVDAFSPIRYGFDGGPGDEARSTRRDAGA
jgi:hypothetical protein